MRIPGGCRFTHTESFGWDRPVIGPVLEFFIFRVFFRKWSDWKLVREDMILDNQYLRDILTEGKYPKRTNLDSLDKR